MSISPADRRRPLDPTPSDVDDVPGDAPETPARTPRAPRAPSERPSVAASLSSTTTIDGVRVAGDAASYVEERLAALSASQRRRAMDLLREAAGIDGNRVLTRAEAERALSRPLSRARDEVMAERAREAELRDGVEVIFNRTPGAEGLTERILRELDEVVAEANGRRADVNVMIFAFTEKEIADKMVAIARAHPNVHIRVLTDWSALATGRNQPPRLADIAKRERLSNLEVKFKKDNPYVWDEEKERPVYDHAASLGLNYHKGFVTLIEGRPRKLVTGSFNWSATADTQNYENLVVLDARAAANRTVMRHFEEEFEAFWNDGRAALTPSEARWHKAKLFEEIEAKARGAIVEVKGLEAGAGDALDLLDRSREVDANDHRAEAALAELLGGGEDGRRIAAEVARERLAYGRFTSFADLAERVPDVARLPEATLARARERIAFGDGVVPVNEATVEDLVALGAPRDAAEAIVRVREERGDFESLEDARAASGLRDRDWLRLRMHLTGETRRVAFSARAPHEDAGDAGFAEINEGKTVPVLGEDGAVRHESATLGAGALDMIRRASQGETLKLATYGLSTSVPEFAALVDAARRGVTVRVILNGAYNEGPIEVIEKLRDEEGLPIDVRVPRRTMHEKFLVHPEGNDVFNGSANLSGGASRRNSEDRFYFKNNPAIAAAFEARFDRLWEESNR